jgi:hypothetical protein
MIRGSARLVYDAVINFWHKHQYAPSIRDLSEATDLGKGTVQWHVDNLIESNHLVQDENISRSLRPMGMKIDLTEARQRANRTTEENIKEELYG